MTTKYFFAAQLLINEFCTSYAVQFYLFDLVIYFLQQYHYELFYDDD